MTLRTYARIAFSSFVLLHLVAWTALPLIFTHALPLDLVEGVIWGLDGSSAMATPPSGLASRCRRLAVGVSALVRLLAEPAPRGRELLRRVAPG
jgi:hypothetical protein